MLSAKHWVVDWQVCCTGVRWGISDVGRQEWCPKAYKGCCWQSLSLRALPCTPVESGACGRVEASRFSWQHIWSLGGDTCIPVSFNFAAQSFSGQSGRWSANFVNSSTKWYSLCLQVCRCVSFMIVLAALYQHWNNCQTRGTRIRRKLLKHVDC